MKAPRLMRPHGTPGFITFVYQVLCGSCSNWHDIEERTKAATEKELRRRGWKNYHGKLGWVCDDCIKAHVAAETGKDDPSVNLQSHIIASENKRKDSQ